MGIRPARRCRPDGSLERELEEALAHSGDEAVVALEESQATSAVGAEDLGVEGRPVTQKRWRLLCKGPVLAP